jgi:hypothetical protein
LAPGGSEGDSFQSSYIALSINMPLLDNAVVGAAFHEQRELGEVSEIDFDPTELAACRAWKGCVIVYVLVMYGQRS